MPGFDKIDHVIADLLDRIRNEVVKPHEFKEGMLAMGEAGGRFVTTIVQATKPMLGLEIGTSSGFSALCAMRGDESGEFQLVTVDHDKAKADWARENFARAGVSDRIEIIVGDGYETARTLDRRWDFVLLDAAKSQNLPLVKDLVNKLNPGAVILTDNATTHASEMQEFFNYVRNHDQLASGLYEVGNGIEVTVKLAPKL